MADTASAGTDLLGLVFSSFFFLFFAARFLKFANAFSVRLQLLSIVSNPQGSSIKVRGIIIMRIIHTRRPGAGRYRYNPCSG